MVKLQPANLELEDSNDEGAKKRRRSQENDQDGDGPPSAKSQRTGKGTSRSEDSRAPGRSTTSPRVTSPRHRGKDSKSSTTPKSTRRSASSGKVEDQKSEPPRRVQKNPHFLQEHRDRYLDRTNPQSKQEKVPSKKGSKRKFLFGNYDTYYNYRNPGAADDPRIQVLDKDWFEGKRALDIGCNSGAVTIEIARRLSPRHILGVDIDPSLVHKARSNLKFVAAGQHAPNKTAEAGGENAEMKTEQPKDGAAVRVPLSVVSHKGVETRPSRAPPPSHLPDPDQDPFQFPFNCSFRKEDYVVEKDVDADYDCVLCLSVTKWVHFNLGDDGIRALFAKVFSSLSPGGRFVLELQEWSSYKKKKTLTEQFKKNCAAIKIRPDMFRDYLLKEVGFKACEELKPPKGSSEGFARPLLVFTK